MWVSMFLFSFHVLLAASPKPVVKQSDSLQEPSGTASFKQKSGERNTWIYLYTLYKQYVLFVSGDAF